MGCCLGLKDTVTAITFVALGTSLPDAFASKAATKRRIGLRDARGEAKATLDAQLLGHLGARAERLRRRSARARTASPHRLSTVAVFPFFATSPDCGAKSASCNTGSSAPAMRRHCAGAARLSTFDWP